MPSPSNKFKAVQYPFELYYNSFTEKYHLVYRHDAVSVTVVGRYKTLEKGLKEFHNACNSKNKR